MTKSDIQTKGDCELTLDNYYGESLVNELDANFNINLATSILSVISIILMINLISKVINIRRLILDYPIYQSKPIFCKEQIDSEKGLRIQDKNEIVYRTTTVRK